MFDRMNSRCFLEQPRLDGSTQTFFEEDVFSDHRDCHTSTPEESRDVSTSEVLRILKSCEASTDLGKDPCEFSSEMDEDVILKVLQKERSNLQVAVSLFNWAAAGRVLGSLSLSWACWLGLMSGNGFWRVG
jgi:hypothetical protein